MAVAARRYDNTGRRASADRQRRAVLAAFVDQLGRPGAVDVSMTEAAATAGVSTRTAHRYFPDRASRVEGLAEYASEVFGPVDHPLDRVDDLPGYVRSVYDRARRHESLTRAMYHAGLGAEARLVRLAPTRQRYAELLGSIGAPPDATRRAVAAVALLASIEAGMPLVDYGGLSFDEAAEVAVQTVEALIADLRHRA